MSRFSDLHMCTLGIDLASQPRDTAATVIDWAESSPRLIPLQEFVGERRLDDSALVELITHEDIEKVAIDAPFGWPTDFVDALVEWRDHQTWPVPIYDSEKGPAKATQAKLLLRSTDREVYRATALPLDASEAARRGKWPLRVTTDKLAFAAMRCVRILAEVGRRQGSSVDRRGEGRIAEVYPDAALREWGLWPATWDRDRVGYKGNTDDHGGRRRELLHALADGGAPWLTGECGLEDRCVSSDDELDALICALLARVIQQGNGQPLGSKEAGAREGWIHLPQRDSLALTSGEPLG